jgi:2-C-methyl-D-erythritol 4-phosphate cytidylyltransferase
MNTAIIVAAGSGERFRSEIPKQFLEVHGKPLIAYTIERLAASSAIDAIVLVLAAERIAEFEHLNADFPKLFDIVAGGNSRAESVLNGLRAVPAETAIVAVHDGARPLVPVEDVDRVVAKAGQTGAACLVAAVTDTIKSVRGSEIAATLDRDKLRRALTPQAFRRDVLERAFELADLTEPITDDSYLVERLGHPVALVEGSPVNIKVTHQEDLVLFEAFLSSGHSGTAGREVLGHAQ